MQKLRHWLVGLAITLSAHAVAQAPRLEVWLPARQEVAVLTPGGLELPGGRLVSPLQAAREYALEPGLWVRAVQQDTEKASELRVLVQVIDQAGKVLAQKDWLTRVPSGLPLIFATTRGPCLYWGAQDAFLTRCYTSDLSAEWTHFAGFPLAVTRAGELAFMTRKAVPGVPPSSDILLDRIDLRTGVRTPFTLKYHDGKDNPDFLAFLTMNGAVTEAVAWQELPGHRFLACLRVSMPKYPCRFEVIDWHAKRLTSLQNDFSYRFPPDLSRDASLAAYLGTSLHLWKTDTGTYLHVTSDDTWQADGWTYWPFTALFTPDNRQVVGLYSSEGWDVWKQVDFKAVVWDVKTGKRLTTFDVVSR